MDTTQRLISHLYMSQQLCSIWSQEEMAWEGMARLP